MKLKLFHLGFRYLFTCCLVLLLNACVGDVGVDPTDDPVQPSNNANAANAEAAAEDNLNNGNLSEENGDNEDLGEEANAGNNAAQNAGNGENLNQGEGVNNAADENFINNPGGNNNLFNNQQGGNNMFANGQDNNQANDPENVGLDLENNEALVNNAEDEQQAPNINQGATDNAPVNNNNNTVLAPVATSPTKSGPRKVKGGGVVRYVLPGGSKLHDRPSGQVVRDLEQGDHPLVSEEGEWARTSDGYYVPTDNLSPQPVARSKSPREWR